MYTSHYVCAESLHKHRIFICVSLVPPDTDFALSFFSFHIEMAAQKPVMAGAFSAAAAAADDDEDDYDSGFRSGELHTPPRFTSSLSSSIDPGWPHSAPTTLVAVQPARQTRQRSARMRHLQPEEGSPAYFELDDLFGRPHARFYVQLATAVLEFSRADTALPVAERVSRACAGADPALRACMEMLVAHDATGAAKVKLSDNHMGTGWEKNLRFHLMSELMRYMLIRTQQGGVFVPEHLVEFEHRHMSCQWHVSAGTPLLFTVANNVFAVPIGVIGLITRCIDKQPVTWEVLVPRCTIANGRMRRTSPTMFEPASPGVPVHALVEWVVCWMSDEGVTLYSVHAMRITASSLTHEELALEGLLV